MSKCLTAMRFLASALSALLLLLAGVSAASAQCYVFSGSGVTFQVNITGFTVAMPTTTQLGFFSEFNFSGNNSLTRGGATQVSSDGFGLGLSDIQYVNVLAGSPGTTSLQIIVPNAEMAPPGAPGEHYWSVMFFGSGNVLPGMVLPAALPPVSAWTGNSNSNGNAYFQFVSGTSMQILPITSVGTCAAGGASGSDAGKALGDPLRQSGMSPVRQFERQFERRSDRYRNRQSV